MTKPDFRALCAALVDEAPYESPTTCLARAALAQPESVAPTDDDLWAVGNDDFRANCYPTDAIRFARAVLARWGTPANTINQEGYEG